jgi:hypothetical protein
MLKEVKISEGQGLGKHGEGQSLKLCVKFKLLVDFLDTGMLLI